MMVTVQHAGSITSYWQPNHLLPYHPAGCGQLVQCSWHPTSALLPPSNPPIFHLPLVESPVSLSPTPVASTVEPEQPIGYGSFGVVWSVLNPHSGERTAMKKIPTVFHSLLSCIRTFREIKIMCEIKHENLLSATDMIQPPTMDQFNDIYVLSQLMESDLHQIIVSPQKLTEDHIKVFIYQIIRGLQYLHSAGIIHRDMKPGNLLVNSNCFLKICDFGFARAIEPNPNTPMTLEVVTQYYRAPELLAGCKHYDTAIDIWSVGCIFAELLGRKILFEATSQSKQLDMITDLLGTPSLDDVKHITSRKSIRNLLSRHKPPASQQLYALSPNGTISHEAVHLLSQLLIFNPEKRISCVDALYHPFLDDGRIRYHTFLCTCCTTGPVGGRQFAQVLEPSAPDLFDFSYEKDLVSIPKAKALLHRYICQTHSHLPPLFINTCSKQYKQFQSCAPGVPQTG
ncbi:serine/threonine-protein kinase NLK2-like [Halichondria panicea]|uniref:serine/threonine-protein kinase NLK2-like n=1 Tax=Halichondria panicea TaxID=6063 RepID=UPI00312B4BFD